MKNEWITVKTFMYAHEVAIPRSRLESEGIPCFVKDELTIQANPFYSNALGGVKLQVMAPDVEAALAVLKDGGYFDDDDTNDDNTSQPITVMNGNGSAIYCPSCGSSEVSEQKRPSGVAFGISVFLLGFPLPFFKQTYHCYHCGKDFKVAPNQ